MIVFEQANDMDDNDSGFVRIGTNANNIPELCEIFERFLLACGYRLQRGCRIGFEWDDEDDREVDSRDIPGDE
jgi:hypothetical protein